LVTTKLSRRQFLSYLFSYLVLLSLAVCVVILILNAAQPSIGLLRDEVITWQYGGPIWGLLRYSVCGGILALLASVVVTTLHGLYFLTEKIHQP
jgi:hypothetical protein